MFNEKSYFKKPVPEHRAIGCLLGGAIGDALGRPNESRNPPKRRITSFEPRRGWTGGPKGTITDDTQLTMALAESLVACGRFDPDDFARRMTATDIRGIGKATRDFVTAWHRNGGTWRGAGQPSSGNGAMMRAAPVGLLVHPNIESLQKMASQQATVSHDDDMARASSVALAIGVAMLIRMERGSLDAVEDRVAFLKSVASAIEGMECGNQYLTRKDGKPATLYQRLSRELPELLLRGASLDDIQEEFWSGSYVLESGPMAFACFLASPGDFDTVVIEAGCKTRDSDTVAAIAGNLAGSFVGVEGLSKNWLDELEYKNELTQLAIRLCILTLANPPVNDSCPGFCPHPLLINLKCCPETACVNVDYRVLL